MDDTRRRVSDTLDGGLRVVAERVPGTGVFSAVLSIDAGSRYEPPGRAGLASLAAGLLVEGTESETGQEFARRVDSIGASFDVSVGYETCEVGITGLADRLGQCLEVLGEVVRSPRMRTEELMRARRKQLAEIDEDEDDPFSIARREFMAVVYGEHPRSRPVSGRADVVAALCLDDIAEFRGAFHVPGLSVLAVSGDIDPEAVPGAARRAMSGWAGEPPALPKLPEPRPSGGARRYVERNRKQTHLMVGGIGVARSDPSYHAVSIMDVILGDSAGFGSRLGRRLREGEGLAYVIESDISGSAGLDPGVVWIYTATSPTRAVRALEAVREELDAMRERPPSLDEVAHARSYLRGRRLRAGESCEERASRLVRSLRYGLGDDYEDAYADLLASVSAEDVQEVAVLLLDPARHSTVVVGPSSPWSSQ